LEAYLRISEATEEGLREELRPTATQRLRNSLLMRAIAEKEGIAVEEDKLNAAVDRIARLAETAQQPNQAEAFARSDYLRSMLQSEMFDRQLTDRLIELATEGRGAVLNPWTAPEADETADVEAVVTEEAPVAAVVDRAEEEADEVETTPVVSSAS
jgi:trigger factor